MPKSPEQQKEQEQSNLDQKKVLETILAALDALAPNGKLAVKEEWKKALGNILLTDYVLIFELLGILLLIALIGAASIARRDKE